MNNVASALRAATARLEQVSDTARLDAEYLMAHALGVTRSSMLLGHQQVPEPLAYSGLVDRRLSYEPLAYITGEQDFYGRSFIVSPDVLIPRSDSEQVVEAALGYMALDARILDCGTGSGALLVTLLAERSGTTGAGIDAAFAALPVAAANAARLGVADRARILRRDWTDPDWAEDLGRFDLIIANPPYIGTGAKLDRSVRAFEPANALFAGEDGLAEYRRLIPQCRELLNPDGVLVLEIGYQQSAAVAAIAQENGAKSELKHDLAGRPRAMILRWGLAK
ncbi:peptide chain release factor N(5)-glutamine methyltransferase [Parerythrobacter jejuensis]|uniref:Release factor glutamine methyltransferase n=1 Tax=Parerythrobacter jejuensis TaxID=795812 RepID=A0A845AKB9_9SPHN|nr:peptide chain release factor N(5)-glutamine methyltransferase [Parerythrobacter jejuensis]MXP30710.1 peptide chain release factor N(5)-glutamine methyltransferase [Parerythrobacter jejuensis]MXP33470.1 peptide chain release factor N(5)-glutamine methyltransferase [Parerythrobacter jejuensis]